MSRRGPARVADQAVWRRSRRVRRMACGGGRGVEDHDFLLSVTLHDDTCSLPQWAEWRQLLDAALGSHPAGGAAAVGAAVELMQRRACAVARRAAAPTHAHQGGLGRLHAAVDKHRLRTRARSSMQGCRACAGGACPRPRGQAPTQDRRLSNRGQGSGVGGGGRLSREEPGAWVAVLAAFRHVVDALGPLAHVPSSRSE
jgi:hypothetical protein